MSIKIKFFGPLIDVVGSSEMEVYSMADTETVRSKMLNDFPKLKNYQFMIAVNKKKEKENVPLKPGDEVALLPPFAGG
jgi:sulfur-carrier protein